MSGIVADNDVEGQVEALHQYFLSPSWKKFWDDLGWSVEKFAKLGLPRETPDRVVWQTCQEQQLVLITGNRNNDEPDSLETTLRDSNQPDSLPVITLARPKQVLASKQYLARTAEKLLEYLMDIDRHRGAGRLYAP